MDLSKLRREDFLINTYVKTQIPSSNTFFNISGRI